MAAWPTDNPILLTTNETILSMTDNNNSSTVPGDAHVTSAEGKENVGSTDTLSLAELNSILGRNFSDKPSALKALKDTQDFVGKRKEDIAKELQVNTATASSQSASNAAPNGDVASKSEVNELKNRLFFSENPQYKGYEAIIKKMGSDPADVVNSEEFKTVYEKGRVADEVAQKKSVVTSSARLAENKTHVDRAIQVANATRSAASTADVLATAIREELES